MKTLIRSLASLALTLLVAGTAGAQTTLTSTTLAAALARTATQMQVASASGIEVGDTVVFTEANKVSDVATVRAINGTFVTLSRGVGGNPVAHASGVTIYHAPPAQFYSGTDPAGTCTRASEAYLPHINLTSKVISQCSVGSVWYRMHEQFTVSCRALLVADMVDQSCWTADRDYVLVGATFVSTTAESGGTLTTILKKQTGTTVCASGTALTSAVSAVSASTAAQTVTSYTLSTTGSALLLASGNRACIDFTDDTAGELAGVTVVLTLAPR